MFIVRFHGGLGNQMFEYAFMKSLEQEYPNNIVKAHIPNIKEHNGYELDKVFGINVRKCSWKEAAIFSDYYPENGPFQMIGSPIYKLQRILFGSKRTYIRQDDFSIYYPEIFQLNPLQSYYLYGAWANVNYFKNIEQDVKNSFNFNHKMSNKNKEYLNKIKKSNSISIHVRHGDYTRLKLPVLNEQFYINAIKIIQSRIKNPHFFIFSDDILYCKHFFGKLENYTIIENNSKDNSFIDMYLMSLCQHNIIANSTFSFWAAYLNSNVNKIVLAPDISCGKCKNPFICNQWIKITAS